MSNVKWESALINRTRNLSLMWSLWRQTDVSAPCDTWNIDPYFPSSNGVKSIALQNVLNCHLVYDTVFSTTHQPFKKNLRCSRWFRLTATAIHLLGISPPPTTPTIATICNNPTINKSRNHAHHTTIQPHPNLYPRPHRGIHPSCTCLHIYSWFGHCRWYRIASLRTTNISSQINPPR